MKRSRSTSFENSRGSSTGGALPLIPAQKAKSLEKAGYRIIGGHSAVKVCHWSKKSLLDEGVCYKEIFYGDDLGIRSHRCLQITPSLPFCDHRCTFCWRDTELTRGTWEGDADDPSLIIDGAIRAQRILLSGFGGNSRVNRRKFKEAMNPTQCAISLAGEPTLYPRINELVDECNKRKMTTFIVTNGQHPEVLERLNPTQLYVSVVAPDEDTYMRVCNPVDGHGWEKLIESLSILSEASCRRAIRLTMARGVNMKEPEKYARLIELSGADFVEVKAYMFVGFSRKRLEIQNMPSHAEIKDFASKLSRLTGYSLVHECEPSRAVLLKKNKNEKVAGLACSS
ncbi:MAG: 4-demethylwyosine synthase TYW1 [Candidatus Hadarchaeales archaeon]